MDFKNIAGQNVAKRAAEIALCGGHRLLFVGTQASGVRDLEAAAWEIGPRVISIRSTQFHICKPCYCGRCPIVQGCECSLRLRERWARKFEAMVDEFDMIVECPSVPLREQLENPENRGTSDQARERIKAGRNFLGGRLLDGDPSMPNTHQLSKMLDAAGHRILELAARRLGFGPAATLSVLQVARTIADLVGEKKIPARAVAEAAQYKAWRPGQD